jgi:hypothetical protein
MNRFDQKLFYMASPALNRELDTTEMVRQAIGSITRHPTFSEILAINPEPNTLWADAVVTFTFPDPALLALGKVPERDAPEVVRRQQTAVLNAINNAYTKLVVGFEVVHEGEEAVHQFRYARASGEPREHHALLTESVTLSMTVNDFRSIHLLKMMIDQLLEPPQLQLAESIRLKVVVAGDVGGLQVAGTLFDGKAARRPVSTWLTLAHKVDVVRYFSVPAVQAMVADACRGMMVSCDQMQEGKTAQKRRNVDGNPITISSPADVLPLVEGRDFGAFYPSIERQDGLVAHLVADLDAGAQFTSLLGPQRAWEACCGLSDIVARGGRALGMPPAARLYSGSRGIHVVWHVDPMAFHLAESGEVACEGYARAVLAVERKASLLESLRHLVRKPAFASKAFLQALVVHALHASGHVPGSMLDQVGRERLCIESDHLAVTLDRKADIAADVKICVDCQPTVHRWLSPHHSSGRITRSIADGAGNLRAEFRRLERVQYESEIQQVTRGIAAHPDLYAAVPGFVPAEVVDAACAAEALGATIAMLLALGEVACCTKTAAGYQREHARFVELLLEKAGEGKKS